MADENTEPDDGLEVAGVGTMAVIAVAIACAIGTPTGDATMLDTKGHADIGASAEAIAGITTPRAEGIYPAPIAARSNGTGLAVIWP